VILVGSDVQEVALGVVERLLSGGGELVTVVTGSEAEDGLGDALAEQVRSAHRGVEVSVIAGGQPHYPVLVGVE
jgi:hypothetical protein